MKPGGNSVLVECDVRIVRPPKDVWQVLRTLSGAAMPASIAQDVSVAARQDGQIVQTVCLSDAVVMEQRVVDVDDNLMVLRLEMVTAASLPWSAYESCWRVQPAADRASTVVTVICLAVPTAEPRSVEGMLRGLLLLGLANLKARAEQSPVGDGDAGR